MESHINYEDENDDQSHINRIYDDFCSVAKKEMLSKLPNKNVVIKLGQSNKRRRILKLWWNDKLQMMWNDMCVSGNPG